MSRANCERPCELNTLAAKLEGSHGFLTKDSDKIEGIVAAINELKGLLSSVENNLDDYPTKQELTQAITDLINGADPDSDTLKELAEQLKKLSESEGEGQDKLLALNTINDVNLGYLVELEG